MHISHLGSDIVLVHAFGPVYVSVFATTAMVFANASVASDEAARVLVSPLVVVDVSTEDEIERVGPMERDQSERRLRSSWWADTAVQICDLMELISS